MKKMYLFFYVFIAFLCVNVIDVNALTYKVKITYNDVNMRTGPGTNYDNIKKLSINSEFLVVDANKVANEKGCADGWYKIYYSKDKVGYICADYASLLTVSEIQDTAENECELELLNEGFPKSYWKPLCELKQKYPNWTFEADINGLDFNTTISKEAVGKKSLIQTSSQGYLSTENDSYDFLTDKFVVKEGKDWYSASADVVAYYMDPRNFLDEKYIFMFEKLSFDDKYQTVDAVKNILNNRDLFTYAETIFNAASSTNINAIYLASRIRQETGANYSSYSLAGNAITYNGEFFEHVYNPYNIGANTGAYDGLVWAVSGKSYLRPWISLDSAIQGGAELIAATYISKGQDSGYFQKFNTSSYSEYSAYSHQYMSNIRAAYSEASIAYNGYKDMALLENTNFTFIIPVYNNMSDSNYELPNAGNPNNHLNNITVNGKTIKGFEHDVYEYTHYVSTSSKDLKLDASAINSNAVVTGIGDIELTQDETLLEILVTAQNGSIQKYTIKVVKTDGVQMSVKDIIGNLNVAVSDNYIMLGVGYTLDNFVATIHKVAATAKVSVSGKQTGMLSTGDLVTIVNGEDSLMYNIVIKADVNGDSNINIQDLLRVQKYILGYAELSGSYLKSADTNQDGIVDIIDLLRIQKHILGYLTIN